MPVVLITGCSSGFGRYTALAFAARGYVVYATVRSPQAIRAAADDPETGKAGIRWLELDVTDRDAMQRTVADVIGRDGRIDVLVNNAGIHIPGTVEDLPDQDIELVMRTNFFGPVWLTRCVLPQMRAQKSGWIIMMSSLSALVGLPVESLYCASKAALEGFAEGLRYEVDRFGIGVSVIEPGLFRTAMPEKIAAVYRSRPDSPYAPLTQYLAKRAAARRGEGDDPRRVADLIVAVAGSRTTGFRYPAGAQAEQIVRKLSALKEGEREVFIRDVQGIAWWSAGEPGP